MKSYKNLYNKKNRKLKFFIFGFLMVLLSIFVIFSVNDFFAFFKSKVEKSIEIEPDSKIFDIAKKLKQNGFISNPYFFSFYCKLVKKANLKYGNFLIDKDSFSYDGLIRILSNKPNNEKNQAKMIVFKGSNMFNFDREFEKTTDVKLKDVVEELNNKDNYEKFEFVKYISNDELTGAFYPMEGFCAPLNYPIDRKADAKSIANSILTKTDERIKDIIDHVKKSNFDLWQIYTIASIIQAESDNEDEMKKISSVIHNRIKYGFKNKSLGYKCRLECDSSDNYALKIEQQLEKDFAEKRRYDYCGYITKTKEGLPRGPICNPGNAAIYAAIYPAETDYYFFCTYEDGSGEVLYAKTLEEHNKNLAKVGIIQKLN